MLYLTLICIFMNKRNTIIELCDEVLKKDKYNYRQKIQKNSVGLNVILI